MGDIVLSTSKEIILRFPDMGLPALPIEDPLVKLRDRHKARVACLCMSQDESLMLSGGEDNALMLYDMQRGDIHTFQEHESPVCAAAFQSSRYAVSIGFDSTFILWDLKKKESIYKEKLFDDEEEDRAPACCLSPNGELAAFCKNDVVKVYDIKNKKYPLTLDQYHNISSLCIGNHLQSLVIGNHDGDITVIDLESRTEKRLKAKEGVYCVDASNSGDFLIAAGTYSGNVHLYKNLKHLKSKKIQSTCIFSVGISSDAKLVFAGGADQIVEWNICSDETNTYRFHGMVHSLLISASKKYCAAGINDGSIEIIHIPKKNKLLAHKGFPQISAICYDPLHQKIFFGLSANQIISWDFRTGETRKFHHESGGGITCLSVFPEQNLLASGSTDHTAQVWDAAEGIKRHQYSLHQDWVSSVCWRHELTLLCTASLDHTVKIIDPASGTVTSEYPHESVTCVVVCNETNTVYSGGNQSIKAFDLFEKRDRVIVSVDGTVNALCICPGGNLIISGSSNKQARVSSLEGSLMETYPCDSSICSVEFLKDPNVILAGGSEGELYLIDRKTNDIQKIPAHARGKVKVALIGKKGYFLSAGSDGFIRIWELASKQAALLLMVSGEDFILFSKDNSYWSNNPKTFIEFYDPVEKKYLNGLDYESSVLQYEGQFKIRSLLGRILNPQ